MVKDFLCDECGKSGVKKHGEWCNECQEKEWLAAQEYAENWYNSCAKCLECANATGPESCDKCIVYNMPLWMCKRKKRCKKFIPIEIIENTDWYGGDGYW